jgi:hypothetical protein
MSNMRQPWNPGTTKPDVSNLKIRPDKPLHPFSNNSSSKQQQTPITSKSGSLTSKTKTSRNSPDPASNMSDRNTSHAGQKGSAVAGRKRSIEKTSHPNSVPTKKKPRSYGRQSSKTSEPDGPQSDDQGYGSDIKLSQIAQTPILVENAKHVSPVEASSIDLTRKRFRPELSAADQQPTLVLVNRKQEHETDCNEFMSFEHSADSRHSIHVRFDVDDVTNDRAPHPQSSDSEAQQFSSPPPASRDRDSIIDFDEMEEDDTVNSFQFAKQTQQGSEKVSHWKKTLTSRILLSCERGLANWHLRVELQPRSQRHFEKSSMSASVKRVERRAIKHSHSI